MIFATIVWLLLAKKFSFEIEKGFQYIGRFSIIFFNPNTPSPYQLKQGFGRTPWNNSILLCIHFRQKSLAPTKGSRLKLLASGRVRRYWYRMYYICLSLFVVLTFSSVSLRSKLNYNKSWMNATYICPLGKKSLFAKS